MPITIHDVAEAASVSVPVVSTVLNGAKGNTRVSEATRKRVVETAERLKYRPLFASRSLARRRSDTLGVFVPPGEWRGIGFDYEGSVMRGVEAVCREKGFDILAINLQGKCGPEQCANKFVEQRIDGLLLLHVGHDAEWVEELCGRHPNVAAVNYHGACRGLDVVNFDNTAAARLAVKHLAELGHRRIGYLGMMTFEETGPGAVERCDGFSGMVADMGLEAAPEWVLDSPNKAFARAAKARAFAERFDFAAERVMSMRPNERPTAWVGYNDFAVVKLMRQMRYLGARAPEDLSFVGIDDSPLATLLMPTLSSVAQPLFEMGRMAAERLIDRAELGAERGLEGLPHVFVKCAPEMRARGSSGRLGDRG
jgi:Transcriptional regulators